MGQVASALSECVHRAMSSRPAYFCELEALRQEVAKLEKEVALMNPWCC